MKRFGHLLAKVGTVYGGIHGQRETAARQAMRQSEAAFEQSLLDAAESPAIGKSTGYMLVRLIDDGYYAKLVNDAFFRQFKDMSFNDIDCLFSSFAIENCVEHQLARVVEKYCWKY